jgi:NAD+ synthase (glutamine-hydrolysing)
MKKLKFAIFQFNPIVGDLDYNTEQLIQAAKSAKEADADVFISSELAICGYPPQDLVLRPSFQKLAMAKLNNFLAITGITMLIGNLCAVKDTCFNSVFVIRDGQIIARHDKLMLPNYSVFDEQRYFTPGSQPVVFNCNDVKVGVLLCEDMWCKYPTLELKKQGAEIVCVMNASPFHIGKYQERIDIAQSRVSDTDLPIIYVNQVGGQDDLIFDGASFIMNSHGKLAMQLSAFRQQLVSINFIDNSFLANSQLNYGINEDYLIAKERAVIASQPPTIASASEAIYMQQNNKYPSELESIYQALVIAVKDYVYKNNFKGIVLGLSGGIDSALVLTIAVDALGSDNVMAVMMPSLYTADISRHDARELVKNLNVDNYQEIAIDSVFEEFNATLKPIFKDLSADTTEENLQARTRGTLLMAISNKLGYLVLTTGNKSEMATGYATLYGDMAGGFAVLKDVPKTLVYKLCNWRNEQSDVIPDRIITRPPSAELRENQTDQDSLPEYHILDAVIRLLLEEHLSSDEVIARGFDTKIVRKIAKFIKINEHKRSQAAIGPKITSLGFTKDWRYPITNHFNF